MSSKQELRTSLLTARRHMSASERAANDAAIGERCLHWWKTNSTLLLAVYLPMQAEPDLRPLYAQLHALGARLALPVVWRLDAPLAFVPYCPDEPLARDLCGVAVPAAQETTVRPDALLIPCLGFTTRRYRLGYGAGYYDRTLAAEHDNKPVAVGIAYSSGLSDFQADSYDMPMDIIITESGLHGEIQTGR